MAMITTQAKRDARAFVAVMGACNARLREQRDECSARVQHMMDMHGAPRATTAKPATVLLPKSVATALADELRSASGDTLTLAQLRVQPQDPRRVQHAKLAIIEPLMLVTWLHRMHAAGQAALAELLGEVSPTAEALATRVLSDREAHARVRALTRELELCAALQWDAMPWDVQTAHQALGDRDDDEDAETLGDSNEDSDGEDDEDAAMSDASADDIADNIATFVSGDMELDQPRATRPYLAWATAMHDLVQRAKHIAQQRGMVFPQEQADDHLGALCSSKTRVRDVHRTIQALRKQPLLYDCLAAAACNLEQCLPCLGDSALRAMLMGCCRT